MTTKTRPEFEKSTITVSVHENPYSDTYVLKEVEGYKLGDTGLGYWKLAGESDYRPTHLPTGNILGPYAMSLKNCKAYLKDLAALSVNWNALTKENFDEFDKTEVAPGVTLGDKVKALYRAYRV